MKVTELTHEQMLKISKVNPEWMAANRPKWMASYQTAYMVKNRPQWMTDNYPVLMLCNHFKIYKKCLDKSRSDDAKKCVPKEILNIIKE